MIEFTAKRKIAENPKMSRYSFTFKNDFKTKLVNYYFMKFYSLNFFLLICTISVHATTYYVSISGNSSNSGLSESVPWSISHAFSTADAGDTVYIKAGDYGALNLSVANAGTVDSPIHFIGYKNIPNDIVSNMGSTMSYGDALDPTEMPLLNGSILNNANFLGTGIYIAKAYIHISNFQITKYKIGLSVTRDYCVINNIIVHKVGDFDPSHTYVPGGDVSAFLNYEGVGISVYSNNVTIHDCLVVNAGAEGFRFSNSSFTNHAYNAVYSDTETNPCDYYYLLANGSDNNNLENIYVERVGDLLHRGHGLVYKVDAQNNQATDCSIVGTNIELQFIDVKENTFTNCLVTPGIDGTGSIRIANASHHNTFINCSINNAQGIIFSDTSEEPNEFAGNNNDFINCIFSNMKSTINYHWYSTDYEDSPAFNNTFYNCVFYNLNYLFMVDRVNYGNSMVNCIVQDVVSERFEYYPSLHTDIVLNFDYGNSNFYNSFDPVDGDSNITNYNPEFIDPTNGNFSLQATSPLIDLGQTTAYAFDIDGVIRPQGDSFDLGIYEFNPNDEPVCPTNKVLDNQTLSGTQTHQSTLLTSSSGTVSSGADIELKSEGRVKLESDFKIEQGGILKIRIATCD